MIWQHLVSAPVLAQSVTGEETVKHCHNREEGGCPMDQTPAACQRPASRVLPKESSGAPTNPINLTPWKPGEVVAQWEKKKKKESQ